MLSAILFAAKATTKHSNESYLILIYIVIFGAFYYFYLRPRSKRQKAQRLESKKSRSASALRPSGASFRHGRSQRLRHGDPANR